MKNMVSEILIAVVVIILIVFLINPFNVFMPSMMEMLLVVSLVILFGLFAGFIWRESVNDEREALHRMIADRIAFLAGTSVIILGIIVQTFKHGLDRWLLASLAIIVIAKAAGLIYGKIRH